jgi:hypothetical protein
MVRKIIEKYIRLGRMEKMEGKLKGWDYFDDSFNCQLTSC